MKEWKEKGGGKLKRGEIKGMKTKKEEIKRREKMK